MSSNKSFIFLMIRTLRSSTEPVNGVGPWSESSGIVFSISSKILINSVSSILWGKLLLFSRIAFIFCKVSVKTGSLLSCVTLYSCSYSDKIGAPGFAIRGKRSTGVGFFFKKRSRGSLPCASKNAKIANNFFIRASSSGKRVGPVEGAVTSLQG